MAVEAVEAIGEAGAAVAQAEAAGAVVEDADAINWTGSWRSFWRGGQALSILEQGDSLDALPQPWNVLKGNMSPVGPEPMGRCSGTSGAASLALRPGPTGPWRVSAGDRTPTGERASVDHDYHNKVFLAFDLAVPAATMRMALRFRDG